VLVFGLVSGMFLMLLIASGPTPHRPDEPAPAETSAFRK